MKIGLHTWGSDGDIRPFVALAGGLSAAGNEVTLAVVSVDGKDYTSLGEAGGFSVRHIVIPGNSLEKRRAFAIQLFGVKNTFKQLAALLKEFFDPVADEMFTEAEKLCAENDAVIGHFIMHPLRAAAELSRTKHITVALNHSIIPSKYITPMGLPYLGEWMNPIYWWGVSKALDSYLLSPLNRFRANKGLPPEGSVIGGAAESRLLNLVAVSPAICQQPPDWEKHHHVCGFFNIPETNEYWEMPSGLERFLDAGPPPVYMTFGSMSSFDPAPEETARMMYDAALLAGCRAIIQSTPAGFAALPEHKAVLRIGWAPHKYIFPHCAAVVHHGGAGSTQSAMRHGCPSIVVEHFGDQPFWGSELMRIVVALKTLHRRGLTARRFASRIRETLDSNRLRVRVRELGARMKHEDGVGNAVELVMENL